MNIRSSTRTLFFFLFMLFVVGIFLYSSISFVQHYHRLSKERAITMKTHREVTLTPLSAPTTVTNNTTTPVAVALIRNWMTFDYINRLFNIPPSYFETRLDVAGTNYPRITIRGLAKVHDSDEVHFLSYIQSLVIEYLHSH